MVADARTTGLVVYFWSNPVIDTCLTGPRGLPCEVTVLCILFTWREVRRYNISDQLLLGVTTTWWATLLLVHQEGSRVHRGWLTTSLSAHVYV